MPIYITDASGNIGLNFLADGADQQNVSALGTTAATAQQIGSETGHMVLLITTSANNTGVMLPEITPGTIVEAYWMAGPTPPKIYKPDGSNTELNTIGKGAQFRMLWTSPNFTWVRIG